MNLNPSDAESALQAASSSSQKMQRALNAWGAAYHLILWGLITLLGFTLTYFHARFPQLFVVLTWPVLIICGTVLSWAIGLRMRTKFQSPFGARIGVLWGLFVLYGAVGAFLVHPENPQEITTLVLIFHTLWMAVMGLWLNLRLLWVALAVAALTLFGYWVLPGYFYLWLALVIGGTMIVSGIFLLHKGK